MKYVFLLSHGDLAQGIKQMAEMVLGPIDSCIPISFKDGMGIDIFKKEFNNTMATYKVLENECIFICDLKNGTPFNVCLEYLINNNLINSSKLLFGLNFPILMTAVEWAENQISDNEFPTVLQTTINEQIGMFEFKEQDEENEENF